MSTDQGRQSDPLAGESGAAARSRRWRGGNLPDAPRGLFAAGPHLPSQAWPDPAPDSRQPRRGVSPLSAYRQKTRYSLPDTAHSWHLVSQRYAYDLVIADDHLRRWREGARGDRPADYLCYGEPILALADGIVAQTRDGVPDAPRPGTGWTSPFAPDFRDDFVMVRHAGDEFSLVARPARGSVRVVEGERVRRANRSAAAGTRVSAEPHLPLQVQDHPDSFGAGLPVAFDGVSVSGAEPVHGCYPQRDTRVRQAVR